jgi:hypothetical protein
MSSRSTQSSSSAHGGVNASGNPNDTIIVLGGTGIKTVLGIHWCFSFRGSKGITSDLLTSRLAVVAGLDLSTLLTANLSVGFSAANANDPLTAAGGRLLFDTQLLGGIYAAGNMALPLANTISFAADAKEGRLEAFGGVLSIIMSAPTGAVAGITPTYVEGILTVQYDTKSEQMGASDGPPGYRYTPVSGRVA